MRNELRTERLLLRRWRVADRLPFEQMNADPRVMEFMPELLTAEASDALIDRAESHFQRHEFGPFAAELLESKSFIGFIGLSVPAFDAHFMPAVEIGWRLAFEYWGKGLATEGARAVLSYGFDVLGLEQIVSFTVPANVRSRRVMEKLGMTHDTRDDFDHPRLAEGHRLRRHVLYRIERSVAAGKAAADPSLRSG
jgi:RimJ/RimL family protein N-acetyltransferase